MKPVVLLGCAALIAAACAPETPPPALKPVATPAEAPPVVTSAAPAPVATPSKADAEPKPDPDRELAKRVMRALEDEGRIHAAAIDVTAAGGVVTLWGTAATPDERQRATRVAYRVIGVTSVQNKLAIASGS